MAIKDQCCKCKLYDEHSSFCRKDYISVYFNGSSCDGWQPKGINLNKGGEPNQPQLPVPNNNSGYSPNNGQLQGGNTKQRLFSKPFSFKGRIRRLEFGLTWLFYWLYLLPAEITPEDDFSLGLSYFYLLTIIPALWIACAQSIKRCHDLNHSGWWIFVPFYFFWLLFKDGDTADNDYGPSPKR